MKMFPRDLQETFKRRLRYLKRLMCESFVCNDPFQNVPKPFPNSPKVLPKPFPNPKTLSKSNRGTILIPKIATKTQNELTYAKKTKKDTKKNA